MSHTPLSNEEKSSLKTILESNVMQKALMEALGSVYRDRAGASSLEQCAMAYNFSEGARTVLNRLLALAEIKEELASPPVRRLRRVDS